MVVRIVITNKEYFYMIDNTFRTETMQSEQFELLPKALKLLKDSNISSNELKHYLPEGYYYETEKLKQYFTVIRNLQENEDLFDKVEKTDELKYLKRVLGSTLYGTEVEKDKKTPLPKMKDIMTLCMGDRMIFPENEHHAWTILKIMDNLPNCFTGNPNLVELAYLTGKIECLVAGCETNILYRATVTISGCSPEIVETKLIWDVDKEVQTLGEKLIDKFNNVYEKQIQKPNKHNMDLFNRFPQKPRVARLGYQEDTREHYYWILNERGKVFDVYSTSKITTENYIQKEFKIL
jgi:hypothetical protein